jgi:hypothetical protein
MRDRGLEKLVEWPTDPQGTMGPRPIKHHGDLGEEGSMKSSLASSQQELAGTGTLVPG